MRKILIYLAVLLFTTQTLPVCADIVSFVNPTFGEEGHFDWKWQRWFEDESPLNWLDITKAPTDQGGMGNTNSVGQVFLEDDGDLNVTWFGAFVARLSPIVLTKALQFGESVDRQKLFDSFAIHVSNQQEFQTDFEEGVPAYIGVMTGDGNYGWIEVIRGVEGERMEFVAIAWAYETIPGNPIYAGQIPVPSALTLLGGLLFLGKSRRRLSQS